MEWDNRLSPIRYCYTAIISKYIYLRIIVEYQYFTYTTYKKIIRHRIMNNKKILTQARLIFSLVTILETLV
jgi:hypothetical protein